VLSALLSDMGADLCSTLGDDERGEGGEGRVAPSRNGGQEVLPSKNFGNFICQTQTVHLEDILCDNWSTELVHFALLTTDVEVFLNQLSY